MGILNERIKNRRQQLGYTLLYIAEQLGVKEATVQRYESGDIKNIKHETVVSIAEILRCDPAYLMGWQDAPTSSASLSADEAQLLNTYKILNDAGRQKLLERAVELRDLGVCKRGRRKNGIKYQKNGKVIHIDFHT